MRDRVYGLPLFGLENPKRLISLCRTLIKEKDAELLNRLMESIPETFTHQALNYPEPVREQLILVFVVHLIAARHILTVSDTSSQNPAVVYEEIRQTMRTLLNHFDWEPLPPFGQAYFSAIIRLLSGESDVCKGIRTSEAKFPYLESGQSRGGGICSALLSETSVHPNEIFIAPEESFRLLSSDMLHAIRTAYRKTLPHNLEGAVCMQLKRYNIHHLYLTALNGNSAGGAMAMGLLALKEKKCWPAHVITSFSLSDADHKTHSVGGIQTKAEAVEDYRKLYRNAPSPVFIISERQTLQSDWCLLPVNESEYKFTTAETLDHAFALHSIETVLEHYYTDHRIEFFEFARRNPDRMHSLCRSLIERKDINAIRELLETIPQLFVHPVLQAVTCRDQIAFVCAAYLRVSELLILKENIDTAEDLETLRTLVTNDMSDAIPNGEWSLKDPLGTSFLEAVLTTLQNEGGELNKVKSVEVSFLAVDYFSVGGGGLCKLILTECDMTAPGVFLHPKDALKQLSPDFSHMVTSLYQDSGLAENNIPVCISFEEVKMYDYHITTLHSGSLSGAFAFGLRALANNHKTEQHEICLFVKRSGNPRLYPVKSLNKKYALFRKLVNDLSYGGQLQLHLAEKQKQDRVWASIEGIADDEMLHFFESFESVQDCKNQRL